jgi:hypothetical protein
MLVHRLNALIRGQRGVALPMALLTMLILSALIIAFSMMAASEPVLANNQLQVAQARAVAESGVQRAIWALNNGGIPDPFVTAVAPYDNSVAIPVTVNGAQIGVFTVSVTPGAALYERNITATGWTPTNTGSGPKVKQVIQVTVFKIGFGNLPSPLTVRGEIDAGGHALIDARADTDPACGGAKSGTTSKGATTTGGSAKIYGADGNNVENQSGDMTQNLADPSVNSPWVNFTYSNPELNALKALAKQNGTYYQGTQTFNASNKLKNGIVYVDTVSGLNIPANPTDNSDFAQVAVHGSSELDPSGIFSGMLIVAGSLSISGTFQMHGVVYVVNDFTYMGTGAGQITGAVMSQNVLDASATSIDTDTGGNSTIIWNCRYVRTAGDTVPPTFIIEKGSYKEIPG